MQSTESARQAFTTSLEAEIHSTRGSFHHLVRALPEANWATRVPGSKWSGKQLLHHITWALEQLPSEVESAKLGKGMFNYPKRVADNGSYWLVKWEARAQTRESILKRYDLAIDRVLDSMKRVEESEWEKGARFYGEGYYSVADLFHTVSNHFHQHAVLLGQGATTA